MESLALQLAEEWTRRPAATLAARPSQQHRPIGPAELEDRFVIVGTRGDEHVAAVAAGLEARGVGTAVFELGAPDGDASLGFEPAASSTPCRGIYCRSTAVARPVAHHNERVVYDPQGAPASQYDSRGFEAIERRAAVLGLIAQLDAPLSMNDPWRSARSELKSAQLAAAKRCGLATPRTIITDHASAVREFAASVGMRIVYKCLDDPIVWRDGERAGYLFTSVVSDGQLAALPDRLEAPGIFQEKLKIEFELRVTVVGDRVFAASCPAPPGGEVDWRRGLLEGVDFESATLDADAESRVLALTRSLGLEFAAVDLVSDGRQLQLLEVNPAGAYLWLEKTLGLPVTDAICDRLIGG